MDCIAEDGAVVQGVQDLARLFFDAHEKNHRDHAEGAGRDGLSAWLGQRGCDLCAVPWLGVHGQPPARGLDPVAHA